MSVTSNAPSDPIGTVLSTAPPGSPPATGAAAAAATSAGSGGRNSTGTCTVSTAPRVTCRSVICCPTCTVITVASDAASACGYQICTKPAPLTRNRYDPLGRLSIFHVPSSPVAVCFTGVVVAAASNSSTVTPATGAPSVSSTTVPPRVEV